MMHCSSRSHNLFHVPCVDGRCHVLAWLNEFSGVVLSCFTLSRYTVWTEVSPIQPEDWPIPQFKGKVYWRSWIRKLVNASSLWPLRLSAGALHTYVFSLSLSWHAFFFFLPYQPLARYYILSYHQLWCQLSPRAQLHMVGMLRFMSKTSTNQACPLRLFCSCVSFCLRGPFNCISFHEFSRLRQALRFLTLFFLFYLLFLSLYESLLQTWYHPWLVVDWTQNTN